LIVFPETVCNIPVLQFEGTVKPADVGMTGEEAASWETEFRRFAQHIETPVLIGLSTYIFKDNPDKPIRLNSALYVPSQNDSPVIPAQAGSQTEDGDTERLDFRLRGNDEESRLYRYDKMHLVLFGEYIPFTEYLPDNFFLKTVCPEAEHGTTPAAIPILKAGNGAERSNRIGQGSGEEADGRRQAAVEASINICFESSVAQLIRNQILALRGEGHDPRVLINLSNDGWFRFTHAMEQHLATHVFRAVENGMYYITAANGGFSAIIDPYGRIDVIGKRGEAEAVTGNIYLKLDEPHPFTVYQKYGGWYALPLALGVLILAGVAFWERRKEKVVGDRS
jgi:apolipoprotein N-acyltransferase